MGPKSTKERIIDAAINLFAEKGFAETSTREIAQMVGVTAASLYNHFVSKEEILQAILELFDEIRKLGSEAKRLYTLPREEMTLANICDCMFQRFPPDKKEYYLKILKIYYFEALRNPEIHPIFCQDFLQTPYQTIKDQLDWLVTERVIDPLDTVAAAANFESILLAHVMMSTLGQTRIEPANAAIELYKLLETVMRQTVRFCPVPDPVPVQN